MTDKSNWRAEKNLAIAAANKKRTEAKTIKVKSELDDKTHWRYNKNQSIIKHGTTTMADLDKPNAPKEKPKDTPVDEPEIEAPSEKKLTEKEIYDLNKSEQIKLIKKLGGTLFPKKEKGRVELIIKLQNDS